MTITPKTDGADKDYAGIYHVDPANNKFSYRTVSRNTYYLSRMKIKVEDVTPVNLTISKIIKGSAANPAEHFTFTLTASRLAGKTFDVMEPRIVHRHMPHRLHLTSQEMPALF